MKGYVGLTDPEWYRFLAAQPRVDEVNFWQPHGNHAFRAIKPGEPFFFKLRAPLKAIAGFGFFARHEVLPAALAWRAFGKLNGASTFEEMRDRIVRLRDDEGAATDDGSFKIGCIMVSAPVFFPPREWVDPPTDWARTGIQKGKGYDLGTGEGARVYRDCLERAGRANQYWNVETKPAAIGEGQARYGEPIPVRPRLGQALFSFAVRDAYRGACAVTQEHSTPVLEAAHIRPFADGGEHRVDNGILLRSDLHLLFDGGWVTVTPDYEFRVGQRLREQFHNGRSYYKRDRAPLFVPDALELRPNRELLEWHQREVFKG